MLALPKCFHPGLKFAKAVNEQSCTLTNGLNFHSISELRSRTLDQNNVYFEIVCIEQYAYWAFSAVFVIK